MNEKELEELIVESGYEDVTYFTGTSYASAFLGISDENRAIYDFNKMIQYLIHEDGCSEEEAIEWIEYNTIRALPYIPSPPIILFRLNKF